jgi:hypothetical protein
VLVDGPAGPRTTHAPLQWHPGCWGCSVVDFAKGSDSQGQQFRARLR